jgi:hypothetical protein
LVPDQVSVIPNAVVASEYTPCAASKSKHCI